MTGSGFDVDGVSELRRAASAAGRAVADTTRADADAAAAVGPRARSTAPRGDTGQTAASVSWGATADGFGVDVGVDWSVPLHWGAPANNQRARPWVAEAFTAGEPDVAAAYEAHLERAVETFEQ